MNSQPVDKLKDELSWLIGAACDGLIAEDQRARLNELLNDRQLRAHYLQYINIHHALTATAGSQAARGLEELRGRLHVADISRDKAHTVDTAWRTFSSPLLRAAAILLILLPPGYFIGNWLAAGRVEWSPTETVAQVNVADIPAHESVIAAAQGKARVIRIAPEVRWRYPNESYTVDSIIRPDGRLRLLEGEIELEYESGVKVLLIAPVDFVLQEIGGELHRGGLVASVPQAGHGFTIATPNGKVVDLGTEFGIMVDDFGVSEVSVFEGKVEAFPTSSHTPSDGKIRLTKGSALQWSNEMLKSLEADPRRLPITLASYTRPNVEQIDTGASISVDFRNAEVDLDDWGTLGEVRASEEGLIFAGAADGGEIPYLVTKDQYDPTLGPVTVICDIRFPRLTSTDLPSFSILTRSAANRSAMERAWRDVLSTCVRCNFRSATDEIDGLLESSTKYERDRELTSLSWRGFRRPQQSVPYRLVMRDDGVNVSFTVTEIDKPSVTKTVTCRSLFQGYENHIALEGWNRGTVIVDKLYVYQDHSGQRATDHFARFATASGRHPASEPDVSMNPLRVRVPHHARLVVEDRFEDDNLDAGVWSVLGDVELAEGSVSLGASRVGEHIDTFHPRPYLLSRRSFDPAKGKLYVMGKIEFNDNYLQGYGGSFAIMSRCEGRYGEGPEWAISALSSGIRCNLWPGASQADHNIEIHEKVTSTSLTFLKGSSLAINPRSHAYYFLVEDSGREAVVTFQDVDNASVVGTIRSETGIDAPRSGLIGFESTWGSRVLLDDVQIYVVEPVAGH